MSEITTRQNAVIFTAEKISIFYPTFPTACKLFLSFLWKEYLEKNVAKAAKRTQTKGYLIRKAWKIYRSFTLKDHLQKLPLLINNDV